MKFNPPIIYVTRDLERAIGMSPDTTGYFIIANNTPFGKTLSAKNSNILLVDDNKILSTAKLLLRDEVIKYIDEHGGRVVQFKPSAQSERIIENHKWLSLNPQVSLANKVEEKISQIAWLHDLAEFLPKFTVKYGRELNDEDIGRIAQFNHAHSGEGTLLLDQEKINFIRTTYANRLVKVSEFISGATYTNNNIVTKDKIYHGSINYQITGLPPFTDNPYTTIGNDWSLPNHTLSINAKLEFMVLAREIGHKLQQDGWRGIYGLDIMISDDEKIYLIEINARQTASTTYESYLQRRDKTKINTFAMHLLSLNDQEITEELAEVKEGAQIILRNQENVIFDKIDDCVLKLKKLNLNVIKYNNHKSGSELLRIQSETGLMKNTKELNDLGHNIYNIIKKHLSNRL